METEFYIYLGLLVMACLVGFFRFHRLGNAFRMLVMLISFTIISEIVGRWLSYRIHSSIPSYHFYVLVSFWMYSYIYQKLLHNLRQRYFVLFISILFSLFSILNTIAFQKIMEFPSNAILVSSMLLVVYSVMLFRQMLDESPGRQVIREGYFWMNTAVLFFFSIQTFDWGLYNYLLKRGIDLTPIVNFGFIASLIFYSLLGFSLELDGRKKVAA
jgi:hypothetical protein